MAQGKRTLPREAAAVAAMAATGSQNSEITKTLGIGLSTVKDIIAKRGCWASIHNEQWFRDYMGEHKRVIAIGNAEVQKKYLMRMCETANTASPGVSIYGYGVTFDKGRLIAGESTEIHEVITREKWDNLNDEMIMIHSELGRRIRVAKMIEPEPEGNGGSNS